jgi:hypothetical protein
LFFSTCAVYFSSRSSSGASRLLRAPPSIEAAYWSGEVPVLDSGFG